MINIEEYEQQNKWYREGYTQGLKEGKDIAYKSVGLTLNALLEPALKQ